MMPDQIPPETVDLSQGLRLAAIALVSAAVTATVVIAIGGALMQKPASAERAHDTAILSAG
jgi:hypothetical protein